MKANIKYMCTILVITGLYLSSITNALGTPPPAKLFGALPKIHDAAISPTSKQVAMIRFVQDRYFVQVITLGVSGENPRLVGLDIGVKPIEIVWANPNRLLISFCQSEKLERIPFTSNLIF
jgi:hypothetical protein